MARSGLPLSARWVRVERARAAAHWRAGEATDPDPQRAPDAAGLVDLLLPGAETRHHALLLAATLLRLAKVSRRRLSARHIDSYHHNKA